MPCLHDVADVDVAVVVDVAVGVVAVLLFFPVCASGLPKSQAHWTLLLLLSTRVSIPDPQRARLTSLVTAVGPAGCSAPCFRPVGIARSPQPLGCLCSLSRCPTACPCRRPVDSAAHALSAAVAGPASVVVLRRRQVGDRRHKTENKQQRKTEPRDSRFQGTLQQKNTTEPRDGRLQGSGNKKIQQNPETAGFKAPTTRNTTEPRVGRRHQCPYNKKTTEPRDSRNQGPFNLKHTWARMATFEAFQ